MLRGKGRSPVKAPRKCDCNGGYTVTQCQAEEERPISLQNEIESKNFTFTEDESGTSTICPQRQLQTVQGAGVQLLLISP